MKLKYKTEINNLYDEYPEVHKCLVNLENKKELDQKKQFILELFELNCPIDFTMNVLIYNRKLWFEFGKEDWKHILFNTGIPERYKFLFGNYSFLGGFVFLNKIIQVNPFELFLSSSNLEELEKKKIIKALRQIRYNVCFEKSYQDLFDEGIYPDQGVFLNTRTKLLAQGMSEGLATAEIVEEYLDAYSDLTDPLIPEY